MLANTAQQMFNSPPQFEEVFAVAKLNPLTFDDVNTKLAYDPETGFFTWKIKPARNIHVGARAGTLKGIRVNRDGSSVRYMYLRVDDFEMPAARVAWLLHYGAWPEGNVLFKDGDPSNIRADNLRLQVTYAPRSESEGLKTRKMSKDMQRHYGLKRYYGLSGEQYGAMVADQKGLCGICQKPETAMVNGVPKVLHVDHCHATNQIRELLCGSCNGMLGLAKDSPETLRAAADYLEKHAKTTANVVTIKRPTDGR